MRQLSEQEMLDLGKIVNVIHHLETTIKMLQEENLPTVEQGNIDAILNNTERALSAARNQLVKYGVPISV